MTDRDKEIKRLKKLIGDSRRGLANTSDPKLRKRTEKEIEGFKQQLAKIKMNQPE